MTMTQYPNQEEYDQEEGACDAFSLDKLFGVATLGALVSVALYWVYQNAGEDTKKSLRDGLMSGFKAAIKD